MLCQLDSGCEEPRDITGNVQLYLTMAGLEPALDGACLVGFGLGVKFISVRKRRLGNPTHQMSAPIRFDANAEAEKKKARESGP